MDLKLSGKSAIITGASRGIGLSIKTALEKEGVICVSLSRATGYDFTDPDDVAKATELVDGVDILINNVGGGGTWTKDFDEIICKNYWTMQELTNEFIKCNKKWGRIVTIASFYGKEKGPNAVFTATKAAQIAFMKCLGGKFKGTTFNTICPGIINTTKSNKDFAKKNKLQLGQPEDIANMALFLCSDLAKHINGSCIVIDGGDTHAY